MGTDRDFLLLASPRRVREGLADVVGLQVRVGCQHLVLRMAGSQESHDGSNRDPETANAGSSAHDVRILRDSLQLDHGFNEYTSPAKPC